MPFNPHFCVFFRALEFLLATGVSCSTPLGLDCCIGVLLFMFNPCQGWGAVVVFRSRTAFILFGRHGISSGYLIF